MKIKSIPLLVGVAFATCVNTELLRAAEDAEHPRLQGQRGTIDEERVSGTLGAQPTKNESQLGVDVPGRSGKRDRYGEGDDERRNPDKVKTRAPTGERCGPGGRARGNGQRR